MSKCEMFGCSNEGLRYFQIAPATNIMLCYECALSEGVLDKIEEDIPEYTKENQI